MHGKVSHTLCCLADFVDTASKYGLIIISELFLPVAKKTIKPASVGGIAGGEKYAFSFLSSRSLRTHRGLTAVVVVTPNYNDRYIVRGIFFKLAYDFKIGNFNPVWMYGGAKRSDEFAIKASGHGTPPSPLSHFLIINRLVNQLINN
jgi:hypothetical protein